MNREEYVSFEEGRASSSQLCRSRFGKSSTSTGICRVGFGCFGSTYIEGRIRIFELLGIRLHLKGQVSKCERRIMGKKTYSKVQGDDLVLIVSERYTNA